VAKVITKEDVQTAVDKAVEKATKVERKRCIAAVKSCEHGKDVSSKDFKGAAVAAINDVEAE